MLTQFARGASALALGIALSAGATAQQSSTFDIDVNNSNFTWSGTTSLGAITTNPSAFQIDGTLGMDLWTGGNPVGTGAFTNSGSAFLVPNTLNGSVSFLATLSLTNLTFSVGSSPFAVDPNGDFTATIVGTAQSGTMTVTPLIGTPTVQDLTGFASLPSAASGTLVTVGMQHTLFLPVTATFPFADPNTGITGSVTLTGTAVATATNPAPSTYCVANPNTTGFPGQIGWSGTTSLAQNDLVLTASNLPLNKNGVFYLGTSQVQFPFSNGFRCVDLNVVRLGVTNTGAGSVNFAFDNGVVPGLEAGDTRHFQFWHRDAGSNLTNALTVPFAP
ncbi:MAG: hypothetical protein H6831_05255 [Planctomycetes bacterium]|nr:hypothetical protein [Planctomycetota bacterium]MCB9903797.1 hypothetical protein [Planctomycetota bacterium]